MNSLILADISIKSIIVLLVIVAAIGVFAWALTTYLPMPPPIKGVIILIAIVVVLLVVLNAFGVFDSNMRVDLWRFNRGLA